MIWLPYTMGTVRVNSSPYSGSVMCSSLTPLELVGEYCELAKSLLIDPKEFL